MVAKPYTSPLVLTTSNQIKCIRASSSSTNQPGHTLSIRPQRPVASQPLTPKDHHENILAKQRLHRPLSPHLSIYKWQINSVNSSLMRITGVLYSAAFYTFGSAYLVSHLLGWHLDVASLAAAFGGLPLAAKVGAKFTMVWPFAFHGFNGVRYLMWDVGMGLENQQVIRSGLLVLVASTAGAVALAAL